MRRELLDHLPRPLRILDAFGGTGELWKHCYDIPGISGVAIEQHPKKAQVLAVQRPHWVVVEGDCATLLGHGLCAWMPFDLLDLDAHGSPLACLAGIFALPRPLPPIVWIVATDGVGFALRRGSVPHLLKPALVTYGRHRLLREYPRILREWLEQLAARHDRSVTSWQWRIAGSAGQLYHWMACLTS